MITLILVLFVREIVDKSKHHEIHKRYKRKEPLQ